METTTKLAIGVSALCCLAATALGGGPDLGGRVGAGVNSFHAGVGFGHKSYTLEHNSNKTETLFSPGFELGYTWLSSAGWTLGAKAQYFVDDIMPLGIDPIGNHFNAMLLAGVMANPSNLAYIEGGYSRVYIRSAIKKGNDSCGNAKGTNGWIAGIGLRHYFVNNVFLDVSYDYAFYKPGGFNLWGCVKNMFGAENKNPPKPSDEPADARGAINGITATLNYLFNI